MPSDVLLDVLRDVLRRERAFARALATFCCRGTLRHAAGLLTLAAAVPAPAQAVAQSASRVPPPITGTVRDSAGAPIANAQVMLAELGHAQVTDARGRFVFASIPRQGTYHLDARHVGFAPQHVTVSVPASGDPVDVTIVLRASPLQLTSVHVTASPIGEADPMRITRSTVELSDRALARNLGASVAQTLAGQPGLAMRYAGPGTAAPVIRGLEGDRILVLQDGQRSGDLSSSAPDHGLSIDPLAAQRIEVVRGPASLLYGNNALGGVVNVISNDIPAAVPQKTNGWIASQGESVNPGAGVSAAVSAPVARGLAVSGRLGARRMGDVRVGGGDVLENSFARNLNGVLAFALVGEQNHGGVAYRGFDFAYGLPASGEERARIEGRRHELAGRADVNLGGWLDHLRVDGTAQWYAHDEVEGNGEVGTSFGLNTQTLSATTRTRVGRLSGALGVSGLLRRYTVTGEEALTPAADSRTGGVFVYQQFPLGGVRAPSLEFGARVDAYQIQSRPGGEERFGLSTTRSFRNVSGSVGTSVPLGHAATLGLSAARAFRAPTVEELFSNGFHAAAGSFDLGDPALGLETNRGLDAVLRAQAQRMSGQLAAYVNVIDGYIAPLVVGDTTDEEGGTVPVIRYTQRDATLRGVEGQIEAEVARHLVLGAMGDVTRGRFRSGGALPFMPAARFGGSVRYDDRRLSVGVEARHALAQREVPENELPSAAYDLVGLSATYTLLGRRSTHTVTLRADNLLDERYADATSRIKAIAPNPGRNLVLVYRVLY